MIIKSILIAANNTKSAAARPIKTSAGNQNGRRRAALPAMLHATRRRAKFVGRLRVCNAVRSGTKTKRNTHTHPHAAGVRRQTRSRQDDGVSCPDSPSPGGVQLRFAIAALHNVRRSILDSQSFPNLPFATHDSQLFACRLDLHFLVIEEGSENNKSVFNEFQSTNARA